MFSRNPTVIRIALRAIRTVGIKSVFVPLKKCAYVHAQTYTHDVYVHLCTELSSTYVTLVNGNIHVKAAYCLLLRKRNSETNKENSGIIISI